MITAIDTSVLLDVLADDPRHGGNSLDALKRCRDRGRLVVSPIVWSEIRAFFGSDEELEGVLTDGGIEFDPIDRSSADLAGAMWRAYRRRGGSRDRILADFVIAAHARRRANRLLTRDRGFQRRYFGRLEIVLPDG